MQTLLRLWIPHFDSVIIGTADDFFAVVLDAIARTYLRIVQRSIASFSPSHCGHVTNENVRALTRYDVPHSQRGVARSAHHRLPVHCHATNCRRVAVESVNAIASLAIPNLIEGKKTRVTQDYIQVRSPSERF